MHDDLRDCLNPNCDTQNFLNAQECKDCGTTYEFLECWRCSEKLSFDTKKCWICNAQIKQSVSDYKTTFDNARQSIEAEERLKRPRLRVEKSNKSYSPTIFFAKKTLGIFFTCSVLIIAVLTVLELKRVNTSYKQSIDLRGDIERSIAIGADSTNYLVPKLVYEKWIDKKSEQFIYQVIEEVMIAKHKKIINSMSECHEVRQLDLMAKNLKEWSSFYPKLRITCSDLYYDASIIQLKLCSLRNYNYIELARKHLNFAIELGIIDKKEEKQRVDMLDELEEELNP